ncbi:MAG: aminomethyl-transferring glycine dehydrogenase [Gammaproteobacteria bacterium]|nr:aminomethyl-transferring glycine dehydrogenase [Gammaproteobacteria bacterium]
MATPPTLTELETRGDFIRRHIGPDREQINMMVEALGLENLEQIVERAVPDTIVSHTPLALTETISERAVISHLRRMRERNRVNVSMIGMGYYGTIMPEVIKRNVLENPGWYTAYTPYQAEISQGRLEALLNFQQMVIDLTGMEIANASMLDEATAAAEAMAMARRISKSASHRFLVDADCHPQTIAVVRTRARYFDIAIEVAAPEHARNGEYFGVLLQYPGSSGALRDYSALVAAAHAHGMLVAVAADPLSLVLLKSPGEMGADIVVGSTQRFGVPMGYGGPHAAFFATRERYVRAMPGRLIGVSVDRDGRPALRMALQTREQHIRREKATSNICTSQVLLAVIAGFYAVYHGPQGLALIAGRVHRLLEIFAAGLNRLGYEILTSSFFDTLTIRVPNRARPLAARAREAGINLRVVNSDHLGMSFDETITRTTVRTLWRVFARDADDDLNFDRLDAELSTCIPEDLQRKTPLLTHQVFSRYHSETEMMRYMRGLARRDIALDRAMIPLGSCTMKLNAAAELQALSYREFSELHPFVPLDQAQGYQQMFDELTAMLCDLTGFAAFSLQPNAGSQGEYAGLLVIRKYHEVRGDAGRDVCLIPASAHGTNPASAAMAGLYVVVIACDSQGNIDLDDLRAKADTYAARLAVLMVTYPSTHGVFEASIRDVCTIIHQHGGQVYMDGANLNALVGICRPAEIGADVMHVNLHKTFAIPHGGGGPGMGPIGVQAHLMAYLPDHPVVGGVNPAAGPVGTIGTVAAAPWGSASILTISWAYIAMMGAHGLRRATMVAILAANYIAHRLSPYYPILYTGKNGMVAHECIIDLRPIKAATGVTVDDIAKRLIDYGFHAPTMSFPVADTLMIEPTESENKREIDRFCEAMIQIRGEITGIEQEIAVRDNNLLKNAPHTHRLLIADNWDRPYTKAQAFFPMPDRHDDKYWPPVSRIDNAHGDKHLVCSCPLDAYANS